MSMVACLEKEGRAAPRGAAGYAAGNRSISDNRHDGLPTRAERLEGQDSEGVVVGVHYRSFPVYDGHGNMIATLHREASDTYSIKNEKRYNAWGSVRSYTNGGANLNPNKAYVANLGHTLDWETGLIYMRARYYEPSTGRFVSEDPARDGTNWFVYCDSNPIEYFDFTGRSKSKYPYHFGGWDFRIDFDISADGDIHVGQNGKDVWSGSANGQGRHGFADNAFPKGAQDALEGAAKAGDSRAKNLLKKMGGHSFGRSGFAIAALTSIDAYAQWDPEDFIGILRDIATGGH